jgi:hypothetical protein
MDHTVFVLVEGSCSEKPFVLLIQLVLSSRMSIVVWIGHVCSSTKTAHLETKETYSCTSTNSVRTFEKVGGRIIAFPLLDWKLFGCFELQLLACN